MHKSYLLLLIVLLSFGQLSMHKSPKQVFLDEHAHVAVHAYIHYQIPASIKLAQAIVETNWGNSKLAREANNYFGIKCKENWDGLTYMHVDDDKNAYGQLIPSCFRAYEKAIDSWEDHSRFLRYRRYYAELFTLKPSDYISWAKGLKKAGYATDPQYDIKLIKVIEQFDLYKYDSPAYVEYVKSQSSSGK